MIVTKSKKIEEIIKALSGKTKIFIKRKRLCADLDI